MESDTMTQSDYAATDGASLIWPEINSHFLSLRGIPEHLQADTPIQATYRRLLVGFDAITSCELKDLYKFTLCLQQLAPEEADCPELRLLVAAFRAWVSFDYPRARLLFRQHLDIYPSDIVALFFTHMFDFCTGHTPELMPDLERCDRHIGEDHPLYSYYLSIKAFVTVEAGHPAQALKLGLESLRHRADNIYGIHAVAHALHEQECWKELCLFLEQCKAQWIDNAGMRMHVYWHLAIGYEKSQQTEQSVRTFHDMYALKDSRFAKQDLDAVAFLWRYRLNHPGDNRFDDVWQQLAFLWSGSIGASMSHFHRLHAALAFAASGQPVLIEKLIAESDGFGLDPQTHQTGVTVLKGIHHFAEGRYADSLGALQAAQPHWSVLGGSRAQRELLPLTLQACERRLAKHEAVHAAA
ncbi:tetratricopeptide repeat protein 38 family protein [Chromobacterium violaceum]|nr:tetratricopeptide repeat protein 38 family protein [Chromobacterium violaceum]OQS46643.1 tetratricopeptide repeat protein 38 family protein [Chromobacterium violaceum]QRO31413.1 tetratricopeptide repeat protein [Chromobacterium violaceum]QRQ18787.1 tetratricopeptide repeat protein [Chromobacterium violaceum]